MALSTIGDAIAILRVVMSAGFWFWILYVFCLFGAISLCWPIRDQYRSAGATLVVFLLLGLLGWAAFGPPIR